MIPVVTPDEMRAIDAAAPEPVEVLVDRAGAAVARVALEMLGGAYGRTVAVLAGPGNNGADGRVAGERLRARGVSVRVHDATRLPAAIAPVDLVIDAGFGTGFHGRWEPPDVGRAPVLAVDVPTGLDALVGRAAPGTLVAARTVTFAAAKPGHLLGDGPGVCGELTVADIGLPTDSATIGVVEASDVARWLPERAHDAHKWRSSVRIVAGSAGMTGAGHLAAAAAHRAGAGMVVISSPGVAADAPIEVVDRRIPSFDWADRVLDDLHRHGALVIGPGLGREGYTIPSITRCVTESVVPVVVDGDGLFALAWNEDGTPAYLAARDVPTVLTPHDGEFGVLTGAPPADDRITDAHRLAATTGAVVLLKGPTTVVADPGGRTLLVDHGDARLATAGTGDVLSGIVGALLARGVPPIEAAAGAAWIHADAGRRFSASGLGMVAGDLIGALPAVLDGLTSLRTGR